jgi:hypothetical protein
VYQNGDMRPMCVEAGQFSAPDIIDRIIRHSLDYGSIIFCESNGVQTHLIEMANEYGSDKVPDLQVWPFLTGSNKKDPRYGIQQVFIMMKNVKWIIPNDDRLCSKEIRWWLEECFDFDPKAHQGDLLMGSWIAAEGARLIRTNQAWFGQQEGDTGVHIFGTGAQVDPG